MWGKMLILPRLRDLGHPSTCPPAVSPTGTGTNCPKCSKDGLLTDFRSSLIPAPGKKKQFSVPLDGLSFSPFQRGVVQYARPAAAGSGFLLPVCSKGGLLKKVSGYFRKSLFSFRSKKHILFYYYAGLFNSLLPGNADYRISPAPLGLLLLIMLALVSLVDYRIKKPLLPFPVFLFYYLLEHSFYQAGVFAGCLKHRYFRCYLPQLRVTR